MHGSLSETSPPIRVGSVGSLRTIAFLESDSTSIVLKLLVAFVVDLAFVAQDLDDLLAEALLHGIRLGSGTNEKGLGDQNDTRQR